MIMAGIGTLIILFVLVEISKHVLDALAILCFITFSLVLAHIIKIKRRNRSRNILISAGGSDPMALSPVEYEKFCGALLEKRGWKVTYTKASGDYGADIIAEKKSIRMAVQCKRWQGRTGVHAVQEVHASASYYKADRCIVVATNGYTANALKLAKSTSINLLHHEDLLRL